MLGKGGRKIYRFTGHEAQATEGIRWGRRNGSFSIYGVTGREIHSDSNPTPKGTNHIIKKKKKKKVHFHRPGPAKENRLEREVKASIIKYSQRGREKL